MSKEINLVIELRMVSQKREKHFAIYRQKAKGNHSAAWWVNLRRRGIRVARIFRDSSYGSSDAGLSMAIRYRDAVIAALPPKTNHEQAVQLRKHNKSGISGVMREGNGWIATFTTSEGLKREKFSINEYGEERARIEAIAQRLKWLDELPLQFITYAPDAETAAHENFANHLTPAKGVLPFESLSNLEAKRRLVEINAHFDRLRTPRLLVCVRRYGTSLSVHVSDAGTPARRKSMPISVRRQPIDIALLKAKGKV